MRAMKSVVALGLLVGLGSTTVAAAPKAPAVSVTSGGPVKFDSANCITVYTGGAELAVGDQRLQADTIVLYARKKAVGTAASKSKDGWVSLPLTCATPYRAQFVEGVTWHQGAKVTTGDYAFYDLQTRTGSVHTR